MYDHRTLKLALQYAALFLLTVGVLSAGILLYMNQASGGDYLKDVGFADGAKSRDVQAHETADAVQDRLEQGLMLVNGLLVLTIPFVSYAMARAAIKPIQQSLEAQQQFVDNAAHELGTPLSVIYGELRLAVSRPRDAKDYEAAIKTSLTEVEHLSDLTKSLTLLARDDGPAVRSRFVAVDLDKVVRGCIASVATTVRERAIAIDYDGRPGAMVRGDAVLLRVVVTNLIDNAIKYSPHHAAVSIKLGRDNGWRVSVCDSGIGMSATERASATQRFWRSDKARASKGRGLGLAIAKEIVELHGGHLVLSDNEPRGLIAAVHLPSA